MRWIHYLQCLKNNNELLIIMIKIFFSKFQINNNKRVTIYNYYFLNIKIINIITFSSPPNFLRAEAPPYSSICSCEILYQSSNLLIFKSCSSALISTTKIINKQRKMKRKYKLIEINTFVY